MAIAWLDLTPAFCPVRKCRNSTEDPTSSMSYTYAKGLHHAWKRQRQRKGLMVYCYTLPFSPIKNEVLFLFAISLWLHDIPHLLLVHLFAYYSFIQFRITGIRVKNAGKLYSFVSSWRILWNNKMVIPKKPTKAMDSWKDWHTAQLSIHLKNHNAGALTLGRRARKAFSHYFVGIQWCCCEMHVAV